MAPYQLYLYKRLIKNCPYVYYVTSRFLQQRYPTKGKSVGCSNVVINTVDVSVLKQKIEKKLDIDSRIRIGTAAALDVRYKGQEYVITAIKILLQEGYDIEYCLAGGNRRNSTYLKELAKKEGVEERVFFCGSLTIDQMEEYYDSLDIYIQPSKQEGLPRAVIEAMSRGCLVLGTNVAGIPELLPKSCLFKKGSAQAVANAVKNLLSLNHKEIAEQNFQKAKEYVKPVLEERRKKFYDEFMKEYKIKGI